MSLKVSHLYKSYDKPIIQDFSYTFEDNHIYAITGLSGCSKTTLLYLLGFLEKKDQGSILIDDKEPKSIQKLYKHTIGFLFQNYALIENYEPNHFNFSIHFFYSQCHGTEKDCTNRRARPVG